MKRVITAKNIQQMESAHVMEQKRFHFGLFLSGIVITSYLRFVGVRQYGKICHMITLARCVGGI